MVTVVSILPFAIREDMPHIHPNLYTMDPAPKDGFSTLVIKDGLDRVYAGDGKHVERIVLAKEIADNLVRMSTSSQMGVGENAAPGLFVLEGKVSPEAIKTNHSDKLKEAQVRQRNWYKNLLRDADDMWTKYHQHRMISDVHRFACTALGQQREWNVIIDTDNGPQFCPACGGTLPSATVTKCLHCQTVIKPEEHKKKFGSAA
jgi:hypothetical protein